jgi:hypothetical protein
VDKTQIFGAKAGCIYTGTYNTALKGKIFHQTKYVTSHTYIQNRGGQTKHPVERASVNPTKHSGYQKPPRKKFRKSMLPKQCIYVSLAQ